MGWEGGRRVAYYCIICVYNCVTCRFARGLGSLGLRVETLVHTRETEEDESKSGPLRKSATVSERAEGRVLIH
jgi:hypothetical protein